MSKQMTLFWSPLELFEACPQKFLWSRGWGAIDVGGGPGRKKPQPLKDSRHHAIMGIVTQKGVEEIYNRELWREPAKLPSRLSEIIEKEMKFELERNFIDWRVSPSRTELLEVCQASAFGYLKTMKANKLLGPYAKAEVELLGWIDKWNPIGGRADMIIRREDTGVTILDGKNSKKKDKDPDQLRWYALCFYLAYGKLPERLGFIYFRFPYDQVAGESGVEWVPCTKDDIRGLAKRALEARHGMWKEKFDPTPSPAACKYCPYETVCEARITQKEARSRNRKPRGSKSSSLDLGEGFVDLSFGDEPQG